MTDPINDPLSPIRLQIMWDRLIAVVEELKKHNAQLQKKNEELHAKVQTLMAKTEHDEVEATRCELELHRLKELVRGLSQ